MNTKKQKSEEIAELIIEFETGEQKQKKKRKLPRTKPDEAERAKKIRRAEEGE